MNRPGSASGFARACRLAAWAVMALCLLPLPVVVASPSATTTAKAVLADPAASPVLLDPAEQAFIQRHPVIRVGIDNDWLPFEQKRAAFYDSIL